MVLKATPSKHMRFLPSPYSKMSHRGKMRALGWMGGPGWCRCETSLVSRLKTSYTAEYSSSTDDCLPRILDRQLRIADYERHGCQRNPLGPFHFAIFRAAGLWSQRLVLNSSNTKCAHAICEPLTKIGRSLRRKSYRCSNPFAECNNECVFRIIRQLLLYRFRRFWKTPIV
jgi:hypothetical protein